MDIKTARGRLFIFLMLIIAFPLLQQNLSFFESGKVNGAITVVGDSTFSWNSWWDGTYQKQKNAYLNDNTGCRPDLVRLNNQIDFVLFNKLHAHGVVLGKDDCLYEEFYIREYNGWDFLGKYNIRRKIQKIKLVQDTLEKLGKTFVFVYAPSKAWYYPDKFPAGMDSGRRKYTNYETFRELGDSAGTHQIDFNAWFLSMKDKTKDSLFSNEGTHWTIYGSLLAEDSLIKYIERVRKISMPEVKWQTVEYSDVPRRTDNDLSSGLNLISHFKKERFTYPKYYYTHDSSKTLPKAIYIGDSFVWMWLSNGLMQNTNDQWEFWYYFYETWNEKSASGLAPMQHINEFDWHKKLLNTDCVITVFTPGNIAGLDYEGEFIQEMFLYFYPDTIIY